MRLIGGLFLFAAASAAAQSDAPPTDYPPIPKAAAKAEAFMSPGWTVVSKVEGDLNRDGHSDVALLLWTAKAAEADSPEEKRDAPFYRLLVGFAQPDGGYRLVVDNKTLLPPPDPFGVNNDPLDADALKIVRGSLDISREYLRGHYRYRFRWSDGAFRLIGYEFGGSDGHCVTVTSINFLTRKAMIETEALDETGEARRFVRRVNRAPVTIEEASSEDYYPQRDLTGPPSYCLHEGQQR
jgi:hypothetical protein